MSSNEANGNYPITIVKDSTFPLSILSQKTSSIKIANRKDERLEYLNISKGLIELLQIHDFTIERILDYGAAKIAEILGIDYYVAQIIFNETNKKNINNII